MIGFIEVDEEVEDHKAASKVQAMQRGRVARKEVAKKRNPPDAEVVAVLEASGVESSEIVARARELSKKPKCIRSIYPPS